MADYQLTESEHTIIRTKDGASIPDDMANRDYNGDAMQPGYLQWVEAGGVADPYVAPEPPPPPPPTAEQQLLFDHENRIRAQEGVPPATLEDFQNMMRDPTASSITPKKREELPKSEQGAPKPPRKR